MNRKVWIRLLLADTTLLVIALALLFPGPLGADSITGAKEMVLRDDLFTMRSVIDQYTLDKQKAPQSLEDLVAAGYLSSIPIDPFTGRRDTWQIKREDLQFQDPPLSPPPIYDIHSGSTLISSDGTAYSSW